MIKHLFEGQPFKGRVIEGNHSCELQLRIAKTVDEREYEQAKYGPGKYEQAKYEQAKY